MAFEKNFYSKSLVIELENGTNDSGNTVYKQKTYANINSAATDEQINEFANKIIGVLGISHKNVYIKSMDKLENTEA